MSLLLKEEKITTIDDLYIDCSCCGDPFRKGTGHLCMCPNCDDKHPLCDECYRHLKSTGKVKDYNYKQKELDNRLVEKLK